MAVLVTLITPVIGHYPCCCLFRFVCVFYVDMELTKHHYVLLQIRVIGQRSVRSLRVSNKWYVTVSVHLGSHVRMQFSSRKVVFGDSKHNWRSGSDPVPCTPLPRTSKEMDESVVLQLLGHFTITSRDIPLRYCKWCKQKWTSRFCWFPKG